MKDKFSILLFCTLTLFSCSRRSIVQSNDYPDIFPDYVGVTVPETMTDLPFRMADGRKCKISKKTDGDKILVSVSVKEKGVITRYADFPIYISKDSIDPYIAYRLIEPGYESWNEMGIYQRELGSFEEKAIVTNKANGKGCVNCHSFASGNPDKMLLHARGDGGGTVFINGEETHLTNLAETGPNKQGTYPAWHPDERYVAFSSNTTKQCFTLSGSQPIEVYDTASDIILMDTQTGEVNPVPQMTGEDILETFPGWSSYGDVLYFCAADNVNDIADNRGTVHYRLMGINFHDGEFIGDPFPVYEKSNESVSFPRANGDWLLFTVSDFGTFPIWHNEADLCLLNLKTGETRNADELNSNRTESYHSWSSNGKWLIFSSRRIDGRYTRLYLSHFDGEGHFSKPFLLPQKDPYFNMLRLKSYNIPEFICGDASGRENKIKTLFER